MPQGSSAADEQRCRGNQTLDQHWYLTLSQPNFPIRSPFWLSTVWCGFLIRSAGWATWS